MTGEENTIEPAPEGDALSGTAGAALQEDFKPVLPEEDELFKTAPADRGGQKPAEEQLTCKRENKAPFMNRARITAVFSAVFILTVFFFAFIYPAIRNRHKDVGKELDKAGKTYIPDFIARSPEPAKKPELKVKAEPVPEDDGMTDEELEKKFPPILPDVSPMEKKDPARAMVQPVQKMQPATLSSRPATNRSPLQKQLMRIPADTYMSSTGNLADISGGSSNPYYSDQSAGGTYTPPGLAANLQNYASDMASLLRQQGESSYRQLNDQSGKQAFANRNNGAAGQLRWNGDYSVWKGTIIPAVLDTKINTDNPGPVIATVTKNIYSSQHGRYLLIPQGTRLFAEYNSSISYAQRRVQVAWNTMIRPDGLEVNLGNLTGVDKEGASGYEGHRNGHPFEYAKALGLIAMFSIFDTEMNQEIKDTKNVYAENAMTDVYRETKRLGDKILDRALDIQPTITINAGTVVNLITNVTMDLPPAEENPVTQKYVRR